MRLSRESRKYHQADKIRVVTRIMVLLGMVTGTIRCWVLL